MMVISDFRLPAPAGSALIRFLAAGRACLATAWRSYRNRRAVTKLLSWDARMLHDIGLTPGDVRSALAVPPSDDPSLHLDALWRERRTAVWANHEERRSRARASKTSIDARYP
jgi:uncharacterized protein YjiS (DUF1127 family)